MLRKQPHVAQIEHAVMRRPVGADQAGAIEQERDRQILQRHFLENLVEAALQERAVDVDDRPQAGLGLAGGKGHGVRFANAGVEEAIRESAPRTGSSLVPWHMAAVITVTRGLCCHLPLDRFAGHVGVGARRALLERQHRPRRRK